MSPASSSVALQPGEGHSLSFWGQDLTFKVRGQDTGGAYAIFEFTLPPHLPAPPLHLHTNCDECVYVLEGVLKLQLDGKEVVLGPGGFAVAHKGAVHTLWNGGDVPVRVLTTLCPATLEGYFGELAELAASLPPGPPPRDRMKEISKRHGVVYPPP